MTAFSCKDMFEAATKGCAAGTVVVHGNVPYPYLQSLPTWVWRPVAAGSSPDHNAEFMELGSMTAICLFVMGSSLPRSVQGAETRITHEGLFPPPFICKQDRHFALPHWTRTLSLVNAIHMTEADQVLEVQGISQSLEFLERLLSFLGQCWVLTCDVYEFLPIEATRQDLSHFVCVII